MTVTQIQPLNKTRSRVFLDGEFAFVLYKGELRSFGIREGEDLSETDYEKILREILPKRARLRAMNLMQSKSYTVQELRRKLQEGDYPEEIVENALEYVASYRYTDDVRYAADYIRYHGADRGRRRLQIDLQRKGVSAEDFDRAWAECEELGLTQEEDALIREMMEKKHFSPEEATPQEQQKMAAFLMRRGFSSEGIRRCMKEAPDV